MPPEPTVIEGEPLSTTSPPVVMPAAVNAPALSFKAGDEGVAEVLLVVTFCNTVRSPLFVVTDTVSVDEIPLYVVPPSVTCPISSAALLSTFSAPTDIPVAMVDSVLEALLSERLPVPKRTNP